MATRKLKTTENAVPAEPKPAKKPTPVKATGQSQFSLTKVTFTTEPLSYRLIIVVIWVAFNILLSAVVHKTAAPFFPKNIPQKSSIINTINKGRAP